MTPAGFAKVLRQLSTVPARVAGPFAQSITRFLRAGFRSGTDPYGKPWAALRAWTIEVKGRTPPPLSDTEALADGTKAIPAAGAGVRLLVGAPYGVFHQRGFINHWTGKKTSRRAILPDKGLPAKWKRELEKLYAKELRKRIKG